MQKLKKMLLISSSTLLASCLSQVKPDLPKEPKILRSVPIWAKDSDGKTQVDHWRWEEFGGSKRWNSSNEETRPLAPICTDLDSYNEGQKYLQKMELYIKTNCK